MEKFLKKSAVLFLSASILFLSLTEAAWATECFTQQNPKEVNEPAPLADSAGEIFTSGDYKYKLSASGTAVITDYSGSETSVSIPSVINGITVTSVASRAFSSSQITEVVVPDTVQTIEADSFYYAYQITRVQIGGKTTLIAARAFYRPEKITFVCASDSKAYSYAKENRAKISLTDGLDLAAATVTLAKTQIVQREQYWNYEKIPLTVTLNGKVLQEGVDYTCIWPSWSEQERVGTKTVTIAAVDYNANHYTGSISVSYDVVPRASEHLCAAKITTSGVQLKWMAADGVSGYYLYRRKGTSGKYELIRTFSGAQSVTYMDQGLLKDTCYQYRITAYQEADGKIYCSSPTERTVYTDSGKKAVKSLKKVKMKTKKIKLKAKVMTSNYEGNWAQPSAVSDFFDAEGRYTIAYSDKNYVYIHILNNNKLITAKTIRIKKKYELVGAVTGGPDGNYYIVWGQKKYDSGSVVLSVAKYDKNGRFLKSCEKYITGDTSDTAIPFRGGNCAVAFRNDVLICYYARQMINTHQSSDVFSVNTKDMTPNTDYYSRVSHSFDQRVQVLSNGDVLFADLGDGGPRGFALYEAGQAHEWDADPFHFYGKNGDNWIYARLGGIGEVSTGIVLVGTSAPSMTKKFEHEDERLFIQIIDPISKTSVIGKSKRKGTSGGKPYTDTGIKWITGKKDDEVEASNVAVMEKDRILVMWEKDTRAGIESYYMVLSAAGKVLQKPTKIGRVRLNECEEIKYRNGCAYWTTADGKKTATVHKLYIGKSK